METDSNFLKIAFAGREFLMSDVNGSDHVAATMQAGSYEAPLPMLLSAMVARTQGLFLDVGANNGLYSLVAAATNPLTRVMAFEPYPPALEVLRSNIKANDFQSRIQVVEFALSDQEHEVSMFRPDPGHGLLETSCSLEEGFIAASKAALQVQTRRLDDVTLSDSVSVIKVDIEGHEAAFLRGAKSVITSFRPFMFVEMLPAAQHTFYEVSKMMCDADYFCFRLRSDTAIKSNFIMYDSLSWNWALVPKDRFEVFRDACRAHNVEITAPF